MRRKYLYKYFCKSRSFKANFSESQFCHVNFRGAIMTACVFKKCNFYGVEFLGTNLRKSNFEGSHFKNTMFVGALLDKCKLRGCTFENVLFVNTNLDDVKSLNKETPGVTILSEYPKLDISIELKSALDELKSNNNITKCRVLHLSGNRYNNLNINMLLDKYSEKDLIGGLKSLKEIKKDICTLSCLIKNLNSALNM
nr:pentapeptide repeat-containing protein [Heliobacterium chlorum]